MLHRYRHFVRLQGPFCQKDDICYNGEGVEVEKCPNYMQGTTGKRSVSGSGLPARCALSGQFGRSVLTKRKIQNHRLPLRALRKSVRTPAFMRSRLAASTEKRPTVLPLKDLSQFGHGVCAHPCQPMNLPIPRLPSSKLWPSQAGHFWSASTWEHANRKEALELWSVLSISWPAPWPAAFPL